jgi:serine/threonine protein kinase
MPDEPAPPEGREGAFPQALGKYVPFARLGSGGMADIFLSVARGPVGFNKIAVIKRLRSPDVESHVEMFLDEARLAARLNHPNLVHTYEFGLADAKYFIAMEYLEGQSLQALVSRLAAREDGLSDALIAYIGAQALRGLHHAHELCDFDGTPLGIVHRDVSPQNLHLTYSGDVKVLDFGIAKATTTVRTDTGILKGKVRYMAPEQIKDETVDRRADLFAFGIVLWELLARRPLFKGDAVSVMSRIVNEDIGSARAVRSAASPALDRIVLKALRRDPHARYATADEMQSELQDFLRGRDDPALDKELARVMNDTFAQTRDEVRARMRAFLEKVPPGEDHPDIGRASELPILIDGSGPHTPPALSGRPSPVRPMPRWSWLLIAVGASVASVVALGRLGRELQKPSVAAASVPAIRNVGHLRLVTEPPGALVERNGKALARTPAEMDLEPGTTTLRLSFDGYEPDAVTFDVTQGVTIDRSIALRPVSAPVVARRLVDVPLAPGSAASRTPVSALAPTVAATPRLRIKVLDDSDSP